MTLADLLQWIPAGATALCTFFIVRYINRVDQFEEKTDRTLQALQLDFAQHKLQIEKAALIAERLQNAIERMDNLEHSFKRLAKLLEAFNEKMKAMDSEVSVLKKTRNIQAHD